MSSTENPIREALEEAISEHDVLLFMKGTPEQPACGFSARTVATLEALGAPFAAVDILPDPRIRQELSGLSNWPTIPQLFVNGELAEALGVQAPVQAPDHAPQAAEPGAPPLQIEGLRPPAG